MEELLDETIRRLQTYYISLKTYVGVLLLRHSASEMLMVHCFLIAIRMWAIGGKILRLNVLSHAIRGDKSLTRL